MRLTLRSIWAGFLALAVLFAAARLQMRLEAGRPAPPPREAAQSESPAPTFDALAVETLRVLDGETVRELEMRDYLFGVLAAEMPADFEPEALKAQAVAARTYALWCAQSGRHENADVCADYRCCQA